MDFVIIQFSSTQLLEEEMSAPFLRVSFLNKVLFIILAALLVRKHEFIFGRTSTLSVQN